jgi:putative nucleotidyltransferase with HDIG domain
MASLQDLIAATPGLSARPDSVASLMDIIENPVVEAEKIVPIVERDPGLTAGLLKLCNSPIYSFRRRIGSPREALVLVGNLTFARLCFALSLEPVLHRDLPGYQLDLDTLWQHSLATAYGAAYLVKSIGQPQLKDRAFTTGLLHDIGKLVLDKGMAEDSGGPANAADTDQPPSSSLSYERQKTGFDHAEAGAALLESWDLPSELVAAVRWHHYPLRAGESKRLALSVMVSDQVAHFATHLQTGSRAIEAWVQKNFDSSAFPQDSIFTLADTINSTHKNIMSLALGPKL